MEDINLHFTGDFHAIGAAHNLLAALLDNHLTQGNALNIDVNRIMWPPCSGHERRALREIVLGLGGSANGIPRESGYDITVASEVMAIFCLSESLKELRERLGKIVVAYTRDKKPVTAADLKAHGAMTVLLKDALKPNLVQTLEGNPAFVHGGPFANIAHGCNSVLATKLALRLGEYTVPKPVSGPTSARRSSSTSSAARPVSNQMPSSSLPLSARSRCTAASLKADLGKPNPVAVEKASPIWKNMWRTSGCLTFQPIVAINHFTADTKEEVAVIEKHCQTLGVRAIKADHWARGGAGAENLARAVVELAGNPHKNGFQFLYTDEVSLWNKVRAIAQNIYGADNLIADVKVRQKFTAFEAAGYGHLPVCMAKTQYSLSTDPALLGRPKNFDVPIRDVKLSAGPGSSSSFAATS